MVVSIGSLKLEDNQFYHGQSAIPFQQPIEIAHYSINGDLEVVHDASELRTYRRPEKNLDLNHGIPVKAGKPRSFETYITKPEGYNHHIDPILSSIKELYCRGKDAEDETVTHERVEKARKNGIDAAIVCWRGLLSKFFITPYTRKEPWAFAACLVGDTIYLDEIKLEEAELRQQAQMNDPAQRQMCYYGYKFEQYCAAGGNIEEPVNDRCAYCVTFRTKLGGHRLLMSGEVDCQKCAEGGLERYIELKTNKIINAEREQYNFERYKLLKYWSQSFIVGITEVVVGYRDHAGILKGTQTLKVHDMPNFVRHKKMWEPSVCMAFADQLLSFVRKMVHKDYHTVCLAMPLFMAFRATYIFTFKEPFTHIACDLDPSPTRVQFMPSWYTDVFDPSGAPH